MKRLLIILLLLLVGTACHAADVTLIWDLNVPSPDGYRVFVRADGDSYNYDVPIWDGALPPATVAVDDGTVWYFVVRAYLNECGDPPAPCESADSNEVSWGEVIVPPVGLTTGATGLTVTWEEVIGEPAVIPVFTGGSLEFVQPKKDSPEFGEGSVYIIEKKDD